MSSVRVDDQNDVDDHNDRGGPGETPQNRRRRDQVVRKRVVPAAAAAALVAGGFVAWNVSTAPTASAEAFRAAVEKAAAQAETGVTWESTYESRVVKGGDPSEPDGYSVAMSGSWDRRDMSIRARWSPESEDTDDDDARTLVIAGGTKLFASINGQPWTGPYQGEDFELMGGNPFEGADPAIALADLAKGGEVTSAGTATLPDGSSAERYVLGRVTSRDDVPGLFVTLGLGVATDDDIGEMFGERPTTEVLVDDTGQVRQVKLTAVSVRPSSPGGPADAGTYENTATVNFTQIGDVADVKVPTAVSPPE
ncbi:MAG: hypothetical protein ACRCYR_15870 [Phycicoccus sp.]